MPIYPDVCVCVYITITIIITITIDFIPLLQIYPDGIRLQLLTSSLTFHRRRPSDGEGATTKMGGDLTIDLGSSGESNVQQLVGGDCDWNMIFAILHI